MDAQCRPDFRDGYDEVCDERGQARHAYGPLLAELDSVGPAVAADAIARRLADEGVSFGGTPFVVDPVPRLIPAAEWRGLEAGLIQRARALNAFLRDAYGERRIVREGCLPAEIIDHAEGYEPDLQGRLPGNEHPAGILGLDVVRDRDGEFVVLEDNLRTPSGYAYAAAARAAVATILPRGPGLAAPHPLDGQLTELLRGAMLAAAPPGCDEPSVVVLTDGPGNVAFYEHRQAADRLGAPLVTVDDLESRHGCLRLRAGTGRTARVDVVYRRTDEDRLRDDDGSLTRVGAALLEPWLAGRIGLVNAFGNGVADDKLVHGYVEAMIAFYLDEEPLVRSVPTYDLSQPELLEQTLERLTELVVKPRTGHGGTGVFVGPHAEPGDLRRMAGELERRPRGYIAQPTIALSRHTTVIEGRLERRHVDLRPFVFCSSDGPAVLAGGLTRVALDAGALVVNSSQNGGGKDTWVLD